MSTEGGRERDVYAGKVEDLLPLQPETGSSPVCFRSVKKQQKSDAEHKMMLSGNKTEQTEAEKTDPTFSKEEKKTSPRRSGV